MRLEFVEENEIVIARDDGVMANPDLCKPFGKIIANCERGYDVGRDASWGLGELGLLDYRVASRTSTFYVQYK